MLYNQQFYVTRQSRCLKGFSVTSCFSESDLLLYKVRTIWPKVHDDCFIAGKGIFEFGQADNMSR